MVFHDIPVQVKIFEKENNFPLVRVSEVCIAAVTVHKLTDNKSSLCSQCSAFPGTTHTHTSNNLEIKFLTRICFGSTRAFLRAFWLRKQLNKI